MPDDVTRLNRRKLYERIWSTPVVKVAKELGVTSYELAKICNRHDIPRPSSAYWSAVALGKTVEKTPLPSVPDPDLDEVLIFRAGFESNQHTVTNQAPANSQLVVPVVLTKPHVLIVATQRYMKRAKIAPNGKLYPDPKICLNIHVTEPELDRALRIYDTLIKYWESIGGSVKVDGQNREHDVVTSFVLNGTSVPLSVVEIVKRTELPRDPERSWVQVFSYHPTGKLVFEVDGACGIPHRTWKDGAKKRIDTDVGELLTGLRDVFEDIRVGRLNDACRQRQNEQLDMRHEEASKRKEQEKERRSSLLEDVANWKKAEEIREYLTAFQGKVESGSLHVADKEEFARWLDWASWFADVCDPLVVAGDRREFVVPPSNVPVSDLDLTTHARTVVQRLGVSDCDGLFSVTASQFKQANGRPPFVCWDELTRILVIHGYDVSRREHIPCWG